MAGRLFVDVKSPEGLEESCLDYPLDLELLPPASVAERYFLPKKYLKGAKKVKGDDMCVLQHSNGLCVISLAPGHPILYNKLTVSKVEFRKQILQSKMSGKKKLGAVWLNELSALADVTTSDGTKHPIYSSVRGNLYEINDLLSTKPGLVTDVADGWVAIIGPKLSEKNKATERLMPAADYEAHIARRLAGIEEEEVEVAEEKEDADGAAADGSGNNRRGGGGNGRNNGGRKAPKGVCFAFQKGKCTRGEKCRFRHDMETNGGGGGGGGGGGSAAGDGGSAAGGGGKPDAVADTPKKVEPVEKVEKEGVSAEVAAPKEATAEPDAKRQRVDKA